jgi:dCMP deaminase
MAEETRPTWDRMFLAIAKDAAKRSKDPSTQVGAVIVGPDNEVRSLGYNCFPRGVDDGFPGRLERPLKYRWVEHGERNAVYNAARVGIPLKGCRIYVSWIPCSDCARAIIQSGMVELVVEDVSIPERWRADFLVSLTMLREARILIRRLDEVEHLDPFDMLWKGRRVRKADGSVFSIVHVGDGADRMLRVSLSNGREFPFDAWLPAYPATIEELEASLVKDGG